MPSVSSELSVQTLDQIRARVNVSASDDCRLPHLSPLNTDNIARTKLLKRRCTFVIVQLLSLLSTCEIVMRLYHLWEYAGDHKLVCFCTRVVRGRDHDLPRPLSLTLQGLLKPPSLPVGLCIRRA
ncbi:hypothetical protein NP493_1759g00000 [Ridgeia piscesae]|uniref:Uncharacterized protein n=1 Tax=Ridgeia piscesae TaxID=27915 RepID=A0AAD9JTL0_RIDPI|nr:hypothetical protein NP493_1759g00000 [Ridgeia piscesae]